MLRVNRRQVGCFAALLLLGAALGGAYVIRRQAIRVNVTNQTSGPITNVRIDYRGGQLVIPQIEQGETGGGYVCPSTETHLTLICESADGTERREEVGGYLEPGYRGTVSIVMEDDGIRSDCDVRISDYP